MKLATVILAVLLSLASCEAVRLHPVIARTKVTSSTPSKTNYGLLYLIFGAMGVGFSTAAGATGGAAGKTDGTKQEVLTYVAIGSGILGGVFTFMGGYFASLWSKNQ
jgi:hypothetical protein